MITKIDSIFQKIWPFLGIAALLMLLYSCVVTPVQTPSGKVITTVKSSVAAIDETVKKVDNSTGLDLNAVAGAAIDAVKSHPNIINDSQSGDWLTISASALGFLGALVGGYALRKKLKKSIK